MDKITNGRSSGCLLNHVYHNFPTFLWFVHILFNVVILLFISYRVQNSLLLPVCVLHTEEHDCYFTSDEIRSCLIRCLQTNSDADVL